MKKLNLSTKVIIPVFIIGILTSLISFYYINKVLQNIIEDEITQKVDTTLDHFEDYIENEFKLLTYKHNIKEKDYKEKEQISKNNIINLLKKETRSSKDIVYIITPTKTIMITNSILSDEKLLKEITKEDEISINSIKYKIKSSEFKAWNWEIVLLHDISNFDNILYENQSFIFTMTFILLASLFIVLIIIFHFNINKPLNILFQHLDKISKGQYDKIEHNFSSKEFQTLKSYINVMSQSVETRENDAKILLQKTKEAEEAKGKFVANMSHEIRTPLNAIIGFTKILSNMKQDKKTEKYVKIIDKSANNLLGIVNDILDLSKIESGNLELEKIKFNPFEEFDSVINLFTAKIHEKNLELIYFIDPKLPQKLLGDPLRLKQVLSNLIANAIKFTNEGYISVRIELLEENDKKCKIKFIIEDTGIGIEENKQKQIFSAFSQADNSITREFGGTGLGLSISSNIIEALNSNINLSSKTNEGTKFDFSIDFEIISKSNKHLEKFKQIKTSIYDSSNMHKLLLPVMEEYLQLITTNNSYENNNLAELKKQDIIFVWEDCVDENIEILSKSDVRIVVIANHDREFSNLENYICITVPVNLSVLFNILIETIDKTHIIPNKENKKDYNKYNAKVLIVEDHKINQELITILFDLRDIKYKVANNGQEAVDIYKKEKFDLILMDINMPIKNGIESTKEILEYEKQTNFEHTPIVALSANAIDSEKQKALDSGMDDYLYKPIDENMLDHMLKKYLKKDELKTIEKIETLNTFDLDEIGKQLGLSSFVVKKLINKFIFSIDADLESLDIAIKNKEYENIKASAHKIKGAALNLRIDDIAKYSLNIESNFNNKEFDFKGELEKLIQAINKIKESLI